MLRVIDLTTLSGAYAARLFAEQGHEVIRIEPPFVITRELIDTVLERFDEALKEELSASAR